MGKTINGLDPVLDSTAANDFQLLPLCDPGTGVSGKMTIAQAKAVFATQKKTYIATGSEGSTLTISELSGKEILLIMRGPGPIYEVDLPASPASDEFTFDDTDIVLGAPVGGAGEKFLIHYRTK